MGYYEDLLKALQKKKVSVVDRLKKEADERQKALLGYLGGHGILYGGRTGKGLSAIEEAMTRGIGDIETEFALKEAEVGTMAEKERKGRQSALLKTLGTIGGGALGVALAPFSGGLSLALPTVMAGMGFGSAFGGLAGGIAGLGGTETVPSDIMGALEALGSTELDKLQRELLQAQIDATKGGWGSWSMRDAWWKPRQS